MGRYVPPELEGVVSFNQASGKGHALGSRARNIASGALTVRFELPFAIWCTNCRKESIIGQGVRFNAEKKKIGNYFSTPIYCFRFKHTACGGTIELQTDPKNTAYIVTEGAKKRDTGEDRLKEGEIVIGGKTEEEKKRLEGDPFARLEEKVGDKRQAATEKTRIEELYHHNSRDWDDPGEANRKLRKAFRVERKLRNQNAAATEALRERIGTSINLLEPTESDTQRAKLIDFASASTSTTVASKPLFPSPKSSTARPTQSTKSVKDPTAALSQQKAALRDDLTANTRAVLDPFLQSSAIPNSSQATNLPLLKRKRLTPRLSEVHGTNHVPNEPTLNNHTPAGNTSNSQIGSVPLVDYNSD